MEQRDTKLMSVEQLCFLRVGDKGNFRQHAGHGSAVGGSARSIEAAPAREAEVGATGPDDEG